MQSFLNEPLRAEVVLLDTRDLVAEDIRIRLAGVDDFDRLGVERSYFLTSIEFDVNLDSSTGRGVIRLTTPGAVLEPYLDIIIEARWPQGRVLREYTVLVDPPAFRTEVLTVSASERIEAAAPDKPAVAPSRDSSPDTPAPAPSAGRPAVAVRESTLAPGEMPERAFSAETAPEPSAGSRYMVRRDETLWEIASRGRPGGVSVQQAMIDIQRVNPEAFIDGNINRIKAGYIIYLPRAGEVDSPTLAAALEEVREQNAAFDSARSAPGVSAAARLRVSADPVLPSDAIPADAPVASATEREASAEDLAPGPTPTAPAPAAADSGVSEQLAARLAEMAERLDTLEQIVALKDEQIATLEQALREAREAAAAPAAPTVTQTPATTPQPAAGPTPVRSPPVAQIPWIPIAGAAAALLLGAALVLMRRRRSALEGEDALAAEDAGDDVFEGVSLRSDALVETPKATRSAAPEPAEQRPKAKEVVAAEPEPEAPRESDRGGSRGYGERKNDDYIDDGAGGDTLAEADIYIAYGRYLQAIELLNSAIEREPDNATFRLKLTELYVDMGEVDSAAKQLEALREHGDGEAIARAEALLGDTAAAPAPADAVVASSAALRTDTFADDAQDVGAGPVSDDPAAPIAAGAVNPLSDQDSDVASSLGADGHTEPGLDLDMDDEAVRTAAAHREAVHLDDELPPLGDTPEDEGFGPIEFQHLEIEEESLPSDADSLDLDATDEDLDLTDALTDLDTPATADGTSGDENEGEDLLIADDADQMATKLDLARAYLDMGDSDGARGILEEVAEGGSGSQQQEARELLQRIG
jgi:pilus assembly protein FimV